MINIQHSVRTLSLSKTSLLSFLYLFFCLFLMIGYSNTLVQAQSVVVLDAGHGGRDPGAVGCQREEATHVLDVVLRTKAILESTGARVEVTRSDDTFIELRTRAEFANQLQADAFVSIHANSNGGTPASGTETWIAEAASSRSLSLATRLQQELVNTWNLNDRGVKRANFTVLTATNMPAALTEIGFINRCDRDSELIGDPEARQDIAHAHALGIADFLSLPPPNGEVRPAEMGTLIGVVFEDQGAGLDDTSIRLGGVEVTLPSTGLSTQSSSDNGAWSFMVEPGNYVVEGYLDGYLTGRRECNVVAGEQAWCSFGLRRDQSPVDPVDMGEFDLDQGVERDLEVPSIDQGMMGGDEMNGGEMSGGEMSGGEIGVSFDTGLGGSIELADSMLSPPEMRLDAGRFDTLAPPPSIRSSEGCQSGQSKEGISNWFFGCLVILSIYLRRSKQERQMRQMRQMSLMSLILICYDLLVAPLVADAHVPEYSSTGDRAVSGSAQAPLIVTEARRIAQGDYLKALISPSGNHVLLVAQDGATISILDLQELTQVQDAQTTQKTTQKVTLLQPHPLIKLKGAGRNPSWVAEGKIIALHTPDQSANAVPLLYFSVEGVEVPPPLSSLDSSASSASRLRVQLKEGEARINGKLINPDVDTFFYARVTSDQTQVVLWGLKTGLWLYRVWDHALIHLGSGAHPSFGPEGHLLVFERSEEEQGALRGADLFCVDLTLPFDEPRQLTQTANRLELAPSVAGNRIVFVDGQGDVWLAKLQGMKE